MWKYQGMSAFKSVFNGENLLQMSAISILLAFDYQIQNVGFRQLQLLKYATVRKCTYLTIRNLDKV